MSEIEEVKAILLDACEGMFPAHTAKELATVLRDAYRLLKKERNELKQQNEAINVEAREWRAWTRSAKSAHDRLREIELAALAFVKHQTEVVGWGADPRSDWEPAFRALADSLCEHREHFKSSDGKEWICTVCCRRKPVSRDPTEGRE